MAIDLDVLALVSDGGVLRINNAWNYFTNSANSFLKMKVFCDGTLCYLVSSYRRSEG